MIQSKSRIAFVYLALSLFSGAALAESSGSLAGRVREHRLPNGLVVLALRKAGAPTVSIQMTYRVGGVDELSGRTGMAHMLEHMLFKGTTTLGTQDWKREEPLQCEIEKVGSRLDAEARKGEGANPQTVAELSSQLSALQQEQTACVVKDAIDAIYSANGAVGFNASTSADLTNYIVSLPSNRLELWAAIEAERMRDPVLREYYSERDVVLEEMRQRVDCNPDGQLHQALLAEAFTAHPYRNPVIGWPSDVQHLDVLATRDFYRSHYGPNNAVIAAVGDLDPDAFFALVDRYFGPLPPGEKPPTILTQEPSQPGPKRVEVLFDAQPKVALAYHKPTLPHRDDYVFDVVEALLTDGRSSRLPRELVDRQRLAVRVDAVNGVPGARYPNLFVLYATPAPGVDPDRLIAAVEAELRRLADPTPSPDELRRVLRRLEAAKVRRLTSSAGLAGQLAYFQAVTGDWRYVEEHPKVLATVTAEEVSAAALKYFVPRNRTIAVLRSPAPEAQKEAPKDAPQAIVKEDK
ncbi:MAG: insulinase family protein [Deltaproteobacteria bacterium]|nr:insulinase family protein [Deltaproteobacteria bacterium]